MTQERATTMPMPQIAPKEILREWTRKRNITPALLAKQTAFSYQHAWNIIDGETEISFETLGVLLIAYGIRGPAPAIAKAMREQQRFVIADSITNGN